MKNMSKIMILSLLVANGAVHADGAPDDGRRLSAKEMFANGWDWAATNATKGWQKVPECPRWLKVIGASAMALIVARQGDRRLNDGKMAKWAWNQIPQAPDVLGLRKFGRDMGYVMEQVGTPACKHGDADVAATGLVGKVAVQGQRLTDYGQALHNQSQRMDGFVTKNTQFTESIATLQTSVQQLQQILASNGIVLKPAEEAKANNQ